MPKVTSAMLGAVVGELSFHPAMRLAPQAGRLVGGGEAEVAFATLAWSVCCGLSVVKPMRAWLEDAEMQQGAVQSALSSMGAVRALSPQAQPLFLNRLQQFGCALLSGLLSHEENASLLVPHYFTASVRFPDLEFELADMRPPAELLEVLGEPTTEAGCRMLEESRSGQYPTYDATPPLDFLKLVELLGNMRRSVQDVIQRELGAK